MSEIDQSGCNCCEGIGVQTPATIYNPPGLSAIAYRVGTYSQFKYTMQARLADSDLPALSALKTREDTDFSLALLDSWAIVADVLTFYQERIANESYKRTARESGSLLELARLVNYKLQPGVAANTFLAFTLETATGSPGRTTISVGTKVQSLPNPGEKPQTFETIEEIEARATWNTWEPGLTQTQPIALDMPQVALRGTNTNLRPGDTLLIVVEDKTSPISIARASRRVRSVQSDTPAQQTVVQFEPYTPSSTTAPAVPSTVTPAVPGLLDWFRRLISTPTPIAPSAALQQAQAISQAVAPPTAPGTTTDATQATQPSDKTMEPEVYAFRVRASLFGYNAPDWKAMPEAIQKQYNPNLSTPPGPDENEWPIDLLQQASNQLALDRVYPQITPGSLVVIEQPGQAATIARITAVQETAIANYALSAKISLLTIDPPITPPATFPALRHVTVYAQSEKLALADIPYTEDVQGSSIDIPGLMDMPGNGRTVIVTGQAADSAGKPLAEITTLSASMSIANGTRLNFKEKLAGIYKRETVRIYGNIAGATQGETIRDEVLGSGDASQTYQRFTLRQAPLTYVQAPTPDGKASTLSIFVDGIRWNEVDTFYGHGPRERIFVTHIENDGSVTVEFGDGRTGARLPTGEDNVHAIYRKGVGTQAIVQPGQLSILQTRPLGVKGVTNPLTPTGANDPETLDDARRNASNTIFTLGRIVSQADYEQYALSYVGVAKAQATIIWNNQVRGVYVTIAGPLTSGILESTQIEPGSGLYGKIYSGMRHASDPTVSLTLQKYRPIFFTLAARVKVDPNYPSDQVLNMVEKAVRASFSFEVRAFGQAVTVSEIIAVMQRVPGVITVRIDSLHDVLKPPTNETNIDAALPHIGNDGEVALAELLMVSPDQPFERLEVMP